MMQNFDRRKKNREELGSANMKAEKQNNSMSVACRKRPCSAAKIIDDDSRTAALQKPKFMSNNLKLEYQRPSTIHNSKAGASNR